MDTSPPCLMEPRTPKGRRIKSSSNTKIHSRSTPLRNRKRYDPQRRLEVAETRRNGACARCREKKVRCSPAQHKLSAGSSPQTMSADSPTKASRSPRDQDLTCRTNETNNAELACGYIPLDIESCVIAAREYLTVAQSHVEEFERFIESWEAAQKQSAGSQSPDRHASMHGIDSCAITSGSPSCSHGSSTVLGTGDIFDPDSQADRTEEINKFLSDLQRNAYVHRDPGAVSLRPEKSGKIAKTALVMKDRNRPLRPKPDLDQKTVSCSTREKTHSLITKSRRSRLKGENEPWSVVGPQETSQYPLRTRTLTPQKQPDETSLGQPENDPTTPAQTLSWYIDYSPSMLSPRTDPPSTIIEGILPEFGSTESLNSYNATFSLASGTMRLPAATTTLFSEVTNQQHQENSFEDFQFPAGNDLVEGCNNIMGTQFNLGIDFDNEIIQGFGDRFVSPLTAHSELLFSQTPLPYLPSPQAPARTSHQVPVLNSDMDSGLFLSDACFRMPSLESTPSSSKS